jgi:hypothetical protein
MYVLYACEYLCMYLCVYVHIYMYLCVYYVFMYVYVCMYAFISVVRVKVEDNKPLCLLHYSSRSFL